MKYCLSARQPKEYRDKADELLIEYRDIDILYDYVEDYPNKKINIILPRGQVINWDIFDGYKDKLNLVFCVEEVATGLTAVEHNFPWYWRYPVTSYYELEGLIACGISEAFLGAPLFFEIEFIHYIYPDLRIRATPNIAYDAYIPRSDGIVGTWFRPEDVEIYDEYVSTIQFIADNLEKERTLYKIYAEDKNWPGNLFFLITNLNYHVDNRGIEKDFAKSRLDCGQRCMRTGFCHLCYNNLMTINLIDQHKEQLKELI